MKNRNGSYKKILLTPHEMGLHHDYLKKAIESLEQLHLPDVDFTTYYILLFLRLKHPKNWLQKKTKSTQIYPYGISLLEYLPDNFNLTDWEKEKLKGVTTYTIFLHFNLKGIPESINRTMLNWFQGFWKIKLLKYIPNSRTLLKMQVNNTRCITVTTHHQAITELVLNSRDPLSFVLHDLMHADQFFNQVDSQKGQLGFYHLLNLIYDQPKLTYYLDNDEQFKKEFEYVVSDMNAYVIHLLKCLKSAIDRLPKLNHELSLYHLMIEWWNMAPLEANAALKLNTPEFTFEDELMLKNFFEKNQEIIP